MNNILSNYPTLEETNGIEKSINDLFQFFTPNRYYADIPIEISEDNNNYYYTLEAPGITTNDINIDVDDNNNLCIEMNKEDKDEQKNKKIYYS
ncbi:MAG: Hsp20/alpha crystallin family protein, partial [Candidatus Woesearchaeota archaeon]